MRIFTKQELDNPPPARALHVTSHGGLCCPVCGSDMLALLKSADAPLITVFDCSDCEHISFLLMHHALDEESGTRVPGTVIKWGNSFEVPDCVRKALHSQQP